MGNARDGERNVARSRLRVHADLDETGDDLASLRKREREREREREKERRSWKLRTYAKSLLPLVRVGH